MHPALELSGDLGAVLDELGRRGVLQLLVEGGAGLAHDLHHAGLVDRYVLYLAPLLFGGDDARGLFAGPGVATLADAWRGRLLDVTRLGDDLRLDFAGPASGPDRLPPRARARYRRRRRLIMFTGIVEELGTVGARDGARLRIEARTVLDGVRTG